MKIDLCALTEDLLPLYAEDLLSPATRQLILDHAAECSACRERLQADTAPLSPPPFPEAPLEKPARRFFERLYRTMSLVLVGVVVLMVTVGGLSYSIGRKSSWEKQLVPARVDNTEAIAARAIPGWERAKAQGLVVDLGITEKVPRTEATITLEKAWYSGRQAYILYTVKAADGEYVLPSWALLGEKADGPTIGNGQTDWNHLSTWGGFSSTGFHSVMIFNLLTVPHDMQQLTLTVRQWAPVTPEAGLEQGRPIGGSLSVRLPWQAAYLQEPEPVRIPWSQQHTWLGRTLALNELQVGIGRTQLTGEITLPEGEHTPYLSATLLIGNQTLKVKDFQAVPAAATGQYHFNATFDGANQWPAPVKLEIGGITFETDKTLEWPVNWAKYRDRKSAELMDPEDQVSVRFYDSELISITAVDSGVSIEHRRPTQSPPHVQASLSGGGRGVGEELGPGFELVNDKGAVMTNLGGGGGTIYDGPGGDQRHGVAAMWWEELPEEFRQSDRLLLRYVHPAATLVLQETWELPAGE